MTHEAMIILHHEDIRKAKEMLKNIKTDLDTIFTRVDRLEAHIGNRLNVLDSQMESQCKINDDLIKLLREANNG